MMPVKKAIIINGCGGVGKDTFIDMCQNAIKEPTDKLSKLLPKTTTRVSGYSSVSQVKKIAKCCGWDGSKTEKDRKFLADLKDLLTKYNDLPLRDMMIQLANIDENQYSDEIVFLAIREPEEILKAVEAFTKYKPITLLVTNDNVKHISSNHADNDVYKYKYDVHIDNSGSKQELRNKAVTFLTDLATDSLKEKY